MKKTILFIVLFITSVFALTVVNDCDTLNTADEYYVVAARDINMTYNYCFNISARGIILNGNGSNILMNNFNNAFNISASEVILTNFSVKNFSHSVFRGNDSLNISNFNFRDLSTDRNMNFSIFVDSINHSTINNISFYNITFNATSGQFGGANQSIFMARTINNSQIHNISFYNISNNTLSISDVNNNIFISTNAENSNFSRILFDNSSVVTQYAIFSVPINDSSITSSASNTIIINVSIENVTFRNLSVSVGGAGNVRLIIGNPNLTVINTTMRGLNVASLYKIGGNSEPTSAIFSWTPIYSANSRFNITNFLLEKWEINSTVYAPGGGTSLGEFVNFTLKHANGYNTSFNMTIDSSLPNKQLGFYDVGSYPESPPENKRRINRFIRIGENYGGIASLNLSFHDVNLSEVGVNESSLAVYNHTGIQYDLVLGVSVDTTNQIALFNRTNICSQAQICLYDIWGTAGTTDLGGSPGSSPTIIEGVVGGGGGGGTAGGPTAQELVENVLPSGLVVIQDFQEIVKAIVDIFIGGVPLGILFEKLDGFLRKKYFFGIPNVILGVILGVIIVFARRNMKIEVTAFDAVLTIGSIMLAVAYLSLILEVIR